MDLYGCAFIAVLILPLAGLYAADHDRHDAFRKPLCNEFRLTAPCDTVDEVGLTFAVRALAVAVDRKAERTHSHIALGMAQLGIAGQTTHQNRLVEHFSSPP